MGVAIHDPIPSTYSLDLQRLRAIELRKELRTTKERGTSEDPGALLAKEKGSRRSGALNSIRGRGGGKSESSSSSYKTKKSRVTCYALVKEAGEGWTEHLNTASLFAFGHGHLEK